MPEPRFVAHLDVVYVNGHPVGRSVMRVLNRMWDDPGDPGETWARYIAGQTRMHRAYRAKRRTW